MEGSVSTTRLEAGIDEAGRGSFFGSVFAAACIMPPDSEACNPKIVKDSKKFSSRDAREKAAEEIAATRPDGLTQGEARSRPGSLQGTSKREGDR